MEEQNSIDKAKAEAEDKLVNDAFQHLLDSYLATRHRKKVDLITKAFNFAKQAHKGVRRLSGEPYIMHPIAVAQIACSEMGLGSTSISAALLHDVVEDTDYTVEDIENIFGHKIAQIVDGLTKISGGIFGEQASAQAENFKKSVAYHERRHTRNPHKDMRPPAQHAHLRQPTGKQTIQDCRRNPVYICSSCQQTWA